MYMEQVIGIYNGKPALFNVHTKECISKRGRQVGNKISYEFVSCNVDASMDIPKDSSIIGTLNIQDYDLTLPKVDPTVFRFGKYKGKKILECTDFEYLIWYYPNIGHIDIRQRVIGMLSNDYFYRDNKFYKKEIKYSENALELISLLKENKDVTLKIDKNISNTGTYIDPEGIIVEFESYKAMKFAGVSYGLARMANGHYARLKNKIIHTDKYDFKLDNVINRYILTIKDFELIK